MKKLRSKKLRSKNIRLQKLLPIIFILIVMLPAAASAETSGWFGGFSLSSEGFISDEIFSDAEWVGLSLYAEPWSFPFLTPSVSAGVLAPAAPFQPAQTLARAELSLELFSLRNHPLDWVVDLENSYAPLLCAGLLMPISDPAPDSMFFSATIAPLRLKTGSGRFSILSLSYITDPAFSAAGWGVRLIDFRLFLL